MRRSQMLPPSFLRQRGSQIRGGRQPYLNVRKNLYVIKQVVLAIVARLAHRSP